MTPPTQLLRPYCTVRDVQQMVGDSDPDSDDRIRRAINHACRLIEDHCQADFWYHDHRTVPYLVKRSSVIGPIAFLPFNVLELTQVELDEALIDLDSVLTREGQRTIEYSADWGAYPFSGTLKVSGTFGYALTAEEDVPEDESADQLPPPLLPASVTRAAILTASAASGLWHRERVGFDGSKDTVLETRISPEVENLLKPWRLRGRNAQF